VGPGSGQPETCFLSFVRLATGNPAWRPVHRLDRDTSGVLLAACDPAVLAVAEAWFRERRVEKTYLALCLGSPFNRTGTVRRALSGWEGGRRPVRTVRRGGAEAHTAYRVLAASGAGPRSASLIAFRPREGRTHQVRVHAAALGHPVLGDDQYGDRPANRHWRLAAGLTRQALHAWKAILPAGGDAGPSGPEGGGGPSIVTAPVPGDVAAAADAAVPGWREAAGASGP